MPAEEFDASSSWMLLYVTPSTTEANSKEKEQSNQKRTKQPSINPFNF